MNKLNKISQSITPTPTPTQSITPTPTPTPSITQTPTPSPSQPTIQQPIKPIDPYAPTGFRPVSKPLNINTDYAYLTDLKDYQKIGDYAFKDDLKGFVIKDDIKGFVIKDDLKAYQPVGSYVIKDDLKAYQPVGSYVIKDDIKGFVIKDDLKAYQPVGNYVLKTDLPDLTNNKSQSDYTKTSDFQLGNSAAPERGAVGAARALVRDNGSALTINYGDDFTGGVTLNAKGGFRVNGDTNVTGKLSGANGYFRVNDNSAQIGANQNNSWILHAPNDDRNTFFIAPGTKGDNWDWSKQTTINKSGDVNVGGNFTVKGKPLEMSTTSAITDYDAFTKASVSSNISKGWNIQPDNISWDPKIRGEGRTGLIYTEAADNMNSDANGFFVDYDVPAGMRTAHLMHLPWNNCNYFDIWGRVGSDAEWQFVTRVNAFQNTRNEQRLNYHDGATLVSIPQVNKYSRIRVQGRKGRIHLMGVGWFKGIVGGASHTNGFVSWESMAGSSKFKVRDEGNGITINTDGYPAGQARMHISGEDELYVLNKKGMIVGKEWGGVGNLNVQGSIVAAGERHDDWTGLNVKRRDGQWTHFDWKDDQKNYIRGDTQIDGNVNIVNRNLRIDNSLSMGGAGTFSIDAPGVVGGRFKVDEKGNVNVNGKFCVQGICIDGPTLASFVKNKDIITIRSDKPGKEQRRMQRGDDDIMKFANNNQGDWERMTIEKL
jgi:hypothetical protein